MNDIDTNINNYSLDDMLKLKKQYGANKPIVDFNILRWPAFMSPLALPDSYKKNLHLYLEDFFYISVQIYQNLFYQ